MFSGTTNLKNLAPYHGTSKHAEDKYLFSDSFLKRMKVKPWGVKFRHFM